MQRRSRIRAAKKLPRLRYDLSQAKIDALARSVEKLQSIRHISDSALARAAHVDQPMVWRAKHKHLKQSTPRLRWFELFVSMALGEAPNLPDAALEALTAYVATGGRIDLLCAAIQILTDAQAPLRELAQRV